MSKMISLMILSLALCTATRRIQGQTCVPNWSQYLTLTNPCQGTPSTGTCSGTITKTVDYAVRFPDTYSTNVRVTRTGQATYHLTCHGGGGVYGPSVYKEFWPIFYSPERPTARRYLPVRVHRLSGRLCLRRWRLLLVGRKSNHRGRARRRVFTYESGARRRFRLLRRRKNDPNGVDSRPIGRRFPRARPE